LKLFVELLHETAGLIASLQTMNGPYLIVKLCMQSMSVNYVSWVGRRYTKTTKAFKL